MGATMSILLRAVRPIGTIVMTDFRRGLRPRVLTRHNLVLPLVFGGADVVRTGHH